MALIDVSELLVDPDFVDPMSLITRTATVDSQGVNHIVEKLIQSIGSIQPASGKTLARLPEALRLADVSSFWFKGNIPVTGPGQYPSVLVFRGRRYQVQTVLDWTNYGQGWCEGTAVAEALS
jgi:hypothetical protein